MPAQSLSTALTAAVDVRLDLAEAPHVSLPVWSSSEGIDGPNRRNPNVWTGSSVDLSGKALWNSFTGSYGTTAISPRHIVYAHHVNGLYPKGTVVRFVTMDDVMVERHVLSSDRVGDSDLDLSTLESELPASVHWFKVMPENWFLRCLRRAPGSQGGLPCVIMDANSQAISVADITGFQSGGLFAIGSPVVVRRRAFERLLSRGDSGSPMFVLLGNELFLDGLFKTARGGTEIGSRISVLNSLMASTGCNVSQAALAGIDSP